MKTKIQLISLLLAGYTTLSAFTVQNGTVVTIGKQTQMRISNLDLQNYGTLIGDTASLLIFSTARERKITGLDLCLFSLRISGDVVSEVQTLTLNGDLIMQSGVLNIGSNRIVIYGDLLGENEKSYVFASTGTIEKPVAYLSSKRQINALGLEFTSLNEVYDLRIYRSHSPVTRSTVSGSYNSAMRVYSFSKDIDMTNVQKTTLPHEVTHISKQRLFVENLDGWQKVSFPNSEFWNVTRITVFEPDDLFFPKLITPTLATNNVFKIIGLEEYPNARLVVINRHGKPLFDFFPYKNDFDGKHLPTGTYYYMFSEDYNTPPIKKSFFEIVR